MHRVVRKVEKILAFFRVNNKRRKNDARYGKIIGLTKSGRTIYENYDNIKHNLFNSRDHYDAAERHKKILEKLSREKENGDKIGFHRRQAHKHFMRSVR